jgi:hypothetical protein
VVERFEVDFGPGMVGFQDQVSWLVRYQIEGVEESLQPRSLA